jgi:uncharacterized membrane protein
MLVFSRRSLALLTAGGALIVAALAAMPWWVEWVGGADWKAFLGRFHPVVLHLPIGIVSLAALLEVAHCTDRTKAPHGAGWLVLGAGVVSSVAAVVTGVLLSRGGDYAPELLARHQWLGIAFACGMVLVLLAKGWSDTLGRGGWFYRALLFGNIVLMVVAGHDGGSLTHGSGFLTTSAPPSVRKLLALPEPPKVENGGSVERLGVYVDLVAPILEKRCNSCHNAEKTKGKLRLDTHAFLLKGGKEGPAVIAGRPAVSPLVTRAELPEDDEERMPPEGKPGFSLEEIVVLKWWIAEGADPAKQLAESNPTAEVREAVRQVAAAR